MHIYIYCRTGSIHNTLFVDWYRQNQFPHGFTISLNRLNTSFNNYLMINLKGNTKYKQLCYWIQDTDRTLSHSPFKMLAVRIWIYVTPLITVWKNNENILTYSYKIWTTEINIHLMIVLNFTRKVVFHSPKFGEIKSLLLVGHLLLQISLVSGHNKFQSQWVV